MMFKWTVKVVITVHDDTVFRTYDVMASGYWSARERGYYVADEKYPNAICIRVESASCLEPARLLLWTQCVEIEKERAV